MAANKIIKTRKISKKLLNLAILFTVPLFVSAAGVTDILDAAFDVVANVLVPLAFSLCLFYFFWGVAKYVKTGAGNEEAAKEGRRIMIWGIAGLFIALSVWGIISFIQSELGIPSIEKVNISN